MEKNFLTEFASDYIRATEGGRKIEHHTYRYCVEQIERLEKSEPFGFEQLEALQQDILNLDKKDKRDYLLERFNAHVGISKPTP